MCGSSVNASMRAKMKHDSRPCGSLPWTLQLNAIAGESEIACAVGSGVRSGVPPMINMLIARFPGAAAPLATGFVRPSSTMRTRSLAASRAPV